MGNIQKVGEVVLIPRASIRPFQNQPRKFFSKTELNNLAESIGEMGQLVPVQVKALTPGAGHDYELIDGQRRWHACDIAKVSHMRAIVVDVRDEDEQFAMSVIANFGRVDHDHVETALAIERIQRSGKSVEQIAKIFAKSLPWVYQHLKVLKLAPAIRALMTQAVPEDERLIFSSALLLADLPLDVQEKTAAVIMKKRMGFAEVKSLVRKRAASMGLSVGAKRTPNKDYVILRTFVGRVRREAEALLSMGRQDFEKMFASRDRSEHAGMIKKLDACMESVQLLRDTVQKSK